MVSTYPQKNAKHVSEGGVPSYTKNLVSHIPRSKDDEIFVVCNKIDGKKESYEEDGITVWRVFNRNASFVRDILRSVKQINPDVVHIQLELSLYGGVHTAYLMQILVALLRKYNPIITMHSAVNRKNITKQFATENRSKLPAPLIDLAFLLMFTPLAQLSRKSIVHEDYFKDILVTQYGISPEKISVINHGVEDLSALSAKDARKNNILKTDDRVALFMGYFTGYKGLDLLIEGFGIYAKKDPHAVLLIGAGMHPKFQQSPKYLAEYAQKQQKAAELIPKDQCRWVGFIEEDDIPRYYCASDVILFPYTISMSSSGPMSLAVGYKKPFLSSDAFAEVLPSDIQFERRPEALANKLADFFNNPTRFNKISEDLRQTRLWQDIGAATKQVYKEVSA